MDNKEAYEKDHDYYLIDLGQASGPVTVGLLLNGVPKIKSHVVLSGIEPDEEGKLPELASATATKAEQELPSLSDEVLATLAGHAARLEEHYGGPQDIEWALDQSG